MQSTCYSLQKHRLSRQWGTCIIKYCQISVMSHRPLHLRACCRWKKFTHNKYTEYDQNTGDVFTWNKNYNINLLPSLSKTCAASFLQEEKKTNNATEKTHSSTHEFSVLNVVMYSQLSIEWFTVSRTCRVCNQTFPCVFFTFLSQLQEVVATVGRVRFRCR